MDYPLISPTKAYFIGVLLAAGGLYNGYNSAIFNPLADPLLRNVYNLDPVKDKSTIDTFKGLVNAIFSIGAMIGVFGTGFLSNKLGRRPLLYLCEVFAILNCGIYIIKGLGFLVLARFVSGLISGMSSVASIVITEMLPNKVSGFGNASGYILGTFAMLMGYMTQNLLTEDQMVKYWRELLCITIITSVIRLILLPIFIRTDTPKYLYLSSESEEVAFDKIRNCYSHLFQKEYIQASTTEAVQTFASQKQTNTITLGALFSKNFRLRLFSGCFLAFAQQLCGINFFIFYSTSIFDEIANRGKEMTLVIGLSNFFGGFCAVYLIGKFGRKYNFVYGCLVQALALAVLLGGMELKFFPIMAGAACAYIVAFAIGLGGSYAAYICEILPPAGVGVAMTIQWVLTAAIGMSVPTLGSWFGQIAILVFFTIVCLLLTIGLAVWTIETKDKSEKEIVDKFERGGLKFFDFS